MCRLAERGERHSPQPTGPSAVPKTNVSGRHVHVADSFERLVRVNYNDLKAQRALGSDGNGLSYGICELEWRQAAAIYCENWSMTYQYTFGSRKE